MADENQGRASVEDGGAGAEATPASFVEKTWQLTPAAAGGEPPVAQAGRVGAARGIDVVRRLRSELRACGAEYSPDPFALWPADMAQGGERLSRCLDGIVVDVGDVDRDAETLSALLAREGLVWWCLACRRPLGESEMAPCPSCGSSWWASDPLRADGSRLPRGSLRARGLRAWTRRRFAIVGPSCLTTLRRSRGQEASAAPVQDTSAVARAAQVEWRGGDLVWTKVNRWRVPSDEGSGVDLPGKASLVGSWCVDCGTFFSRGEHAPCVTCGGRWFSVGPWASRNVRDGFVCAREREPEWAARRRTAWLHRPAGRLVWATLAGGREMATRTLSRARVEGDRVVVQVVGVSEAVDVSLLRLREEEVLCSPGDEAAAIRTGSDASLGETREEQLERVAARAERGIAALGQALQSVTTTIGACSVELEKLVEAMGEMEGGVVKEEWFERADGEARVGDLRGSTVLAGETMQGDFEAIECAMRAWGGAAIREAGEFAGWVIALDAKGLERWSTERCADGVIFLRIRPDAVTFSVGRDIAVEGHDFAREACAEIARRRRGEGPRSAVRPPSKRHLEGVMGVGLPRIDATDVKAEHLALVAVAIGGALGVEPKAVACTMKLDSPGAVFVATVRLGRDPREAEVLACACSLWSLRVVYGLEVRLELCARPGWIRVVEADETQAWESPPWGDPVPATLHEALEQEVKRGWLPPKETSEGLALWLGAALMSLEGVAAKEPGLLRIAERASKVAMGYLTDASRMLAVERAVWRVLRQPVLQAPLVFLQRTEDGRVLAKQSPDGNGVVAVGRTSAEALRAFADALQDEPVKAGS